MAIPNLGAGNNGREPKIDIKEKIKDEKALEFDEWTQGEEGNNLPTFSFNLKTYDKDIVEFSAKYTDLYDTDEDKKWDKEEFIIGDYIPFYESTENNLDNTFDFFNKNNDDKTDASVFAAMLSVIDQQDSKKDGIITFDNYAE